MVRPDAGENATIALSGHRAFQEDRCNEDHRNLSTSLIHSRPLIGQEFYRRFLPYRQYLEGTREWPEGGSREAVEKAAGKGTFRQVRTDVPDREEVDRLWTETSKSLGIQ